MALSSAFNPALLSLACFDCGAAHDLSQPRSTCTACGRPLVAHYDLERVRRETPRESLNRFGTDLWRYRAMLPFSSSFDVVRLGEGGTPLLPLPRTGEALGVAELWLKEEGGNPTHSFKARGLALAVNGALAFGVRGIALPSAGNAGSAAAAYAAAAGLACRVTIPETTPEAFLLELKAFGAEVRLVPGTIADAGRELASWAPAPQWWNVATFKEPFRLEGKKTLGYEIAEQLSWRPPDVILYPTGGGTGLIGMWKAFDEMQALGWIDARRPRMVAIQPEGCAPMVRAFERGLETAPPWEDPAPTIAYGLRVPGALGDFLILRALRESGGTAVAVNEDELCEGATLMATRLGLQGSAEGGACVAAARKLREAGWLSDSDVVVAFNTGHALKYR